MHRQAVASRERPASPGNNWPKQEVRALRQALKDVPAVVDKNERFRRVSALVGGSHSKKECYDKYKELKSEAKLKQTASRKNSAVAEASSSREHHRAPMKHTETIHDGDAALPRGDEVPRSTTELGRQDAVESTAAGSVAGSAESGLFSARSSTFSSSSSHSAEFSSKRQQREHAQQQHRGSATLSTSSSASLGPREDVNSRSSTELGIGGSVDYVENRHGSVDQMGAPALPLHVSGGETPFQGRSSRTNESLAGRTTANYLEDSTDGATQEAARCGGEHMEVEEVAEEDFCREEELLAVDRYCAVEVAHAKGQGERCGGADHAGRSGAGQSTPARGEVSYEEGTKPGGAMAVTEAEANGARALVFGDPLKRFNDAWREQGFYFCAVDGLRYGLVQAEGGPCGVLAAVQAFLLEDMIFGSYAGCEWKNPKRSQRERSLASALSSIIWRAGDGNTAVLALSEGSATVHRSSRYRPDGFTEKLKLHRVGSRRALVGLVLDNISHFRVKKGQGVILLVYSCIFGRGVEAVRRDMDTGFGEAPTLMASHGYASQELVNLLLLGRAHSNVFDGRRVVGEEHRGVMIGGGAGTREIAEETEAGDRIVLTGVPERGRVGLLTLFEAYHHVEVGDRLKSPVNPIWVVCSESHYSVLFSPDRSIVPHSPARPTAPTGAASEGAVEQPDAREGGSRDSTSKPAYSIANITSGGRADLIKDVSPGGGGIGKGALRSANREGTGWYRGEEHRCPPCGEEGVAETFDLEYYDGLGRQDEVIRLTVDQRHDARGLALPPTIDDEASGVLVPPLDLVIRTRWPGATVDWNGTDPIL